jgi:putative AbiEi antitoxin of type IV toxin-antitoxin system
VVTNALTDLVRKGRVERPQRGLYMPLGQVLEGETPERKE